MERKNLLWTTLSGCLYALGPVVFLIVISNALGDTAAGVYSTASMIAMQLITLGKYSVRNFQASDVRKEYSFSEYYSFRLVTSGLMMLIATGWAFLGGYQNEVRVTILCFTVYKVGESVTDVFEGELQRLLHLELAGRIQFIMNAILISAFVGTVLLTKNLMIATIVLAVLSVIIFFALYLPVTRQYIRPSWTLHRRTVKGLVAACLALFLGSFFYSFLNNTPRYAISAIFPPSENLVVLARFNQLFMPVFAIDMLAGFTMRTWLAPMAQALAKQDEHEVGRKIRMQMGVIGAITVIAMVAMYLVGGEVLGFIYHTDLSAYRLELVLLMLAGGFVALQTLYENVLTIYRGQKYSIVFNIASAVASAFIVLLSVYAWGIFGAVIGYLVACVIRAVGYMIIALVYRRKYNRELLNGGNV